MNREIIGYNATVKYKDSNIKFNVFIKVGSFNEETATEQEKADDEDIFSYIEHAAEIGMLMDENNDKDFIVLQANPEYSHE